jgi:hypothetical protein
MEKGKIKGISLLTGPGGDFGPAGARARATARQAAQLAHGNGNGAGKAPWARAHTSEGGGVTASGGKAVYGGENRLPVKFRGGSSPVVRFCVDGMVERHEQR